MSVPEWVGDIPTWIGAGGALGAAWFAYQTITSQRQQIGEQQVFIAEQTRFMDEQRQNLLLEREALEAGELERRVAHLRGVTFGAEFKSEHYVSQGRHWIVFYWEANLTNGTAQPLSDVVVTFGPVIEQGEVTLSTDERHTPSGTPVPWLSAGEGATFTSIPAEDDNVVREGVPRVQFTDALGCRWGLDLNGDYEEM